MYKKIFLVLILLNLNNLNSNDKRFAIIIPSYKNAQFYKKNLDSVVSQKYDKSKFRVVYIDDASPWEDNTVQLVEKYIKDNNLQNLITLRKNKIRRGAMANLWSEISLCDHDEIVVMVDGDDSLKDENVLNHLNKVYSNSNVWLTYGQYECDPAEAGKGFAADYPNEIVKNRDFRKNFLATHLRTYYAWLFQNIKLKDLIYDDAFLSMTWDVAIMFPALEMCGDKFRFIDKILYKYNMNNPLSDYKTDPTLMFYLADFYKNKKNKYPQLYEPNYINIKSRYDEPAAVGFIYGIDKYLSPGSNINDRDFKGRTPLIQSIKFGIFSLTEFLIDKGANVNIADNDGLTPLMYAAIFSKVDVAKLLIANNADVNAVNNFGFDALYYARKHNKNDIIDILQSEKNNKINPKNNENETIQVPIQIKNEPKSFIESKLIKYKDLLDNGTYEGQDWSKFKQLPKSRYYTFLKAFEYFEANKSKIIVELGTSRSFVHGGLPGCNMDDIQYWQEDNPKSWDWGAGFFTRMACEALNHLKPTIYTVDIAPAHIERCKVITQKFKDIVQYHVKSSIDFLKECQKESIDLLYIDTGDMSPIDPSAFLQLEEAKVIVEKELLSKNGIILIDDVKNQTAKKFGETSQLGKSKFSLPFFLRHGYEIIENEYQIILRRNLKNNLFHP